MNPQPPIPPPPKREIYHLADLPAAAQLACYLVDDILARHCEHFRSVSHILEGMPESVSWIGLSHRFAIHPSLYDEWMQRIGSAHRTVDQFLAQGLFTNPVHEKVPDTTPGPLHQTRPKKRLRRIQKAWVTLRERLLPSTLRLEHPSVRQVYPPEMFQPIALTLDLTSRRAAARFAWFVLMRSLFRGRHAFDVHILYPRANTVRSAPVSEAVLNN